MRIKRLVVGELAVNCYILIDEETMSACVVDPGGEAERIYKTIKAENIKVECIVLTHCHFDHIGAVTQLKELFDVPVIIPKDEAVIASNPAYNLTVMFGGEGFTIDFDKTVEDGDKIKFGNLEMKVIATPGHTPGGCCYYFENAHVLISGDTLFFMSIGRSDFPLSDGRKLKESIKQKLFSLPDDTQVFTGHGDMTTIGFEKENNSYVARNRE